MTKILQDGAALVVAQEMDPTADLVVDELSVRRVPVMQFDLADFPQRMSLSSRHDSSPWSGLLTDPVRGVRLEGVRAVYYRRPHLPVVADSLKSPYRKWSEEQALAGILGTLYGLPVRWVNRPDVDGIASHKPGQLPVASSCGLKTPRSLITTDPQSARAFCDSVGGRAVCKPLMGGPLEHPDGRRNAVPTHIVEADMIDESVSLTAHLFQEWVQKSHEIRLTVVGTEMFAAEIHAGNEETRIDWRTDYDALTYKTTRVPEEVQHGVLSWLGHFGLNFGAFDFAVTPSGDWVFFECNPSGQWSWIQNKTGLPIARAVARLLSEGM